MMCGDDVVAVVTTPSGRKEYPKIEDNKNGTVTIKYQPKETGLHEMEVCYNNQPIQGLLASLFLQPHYGH